MRCLSKTENELMKEFLKYLISIKRIVNINTKIHTLATELALDYIMRKNRLKQQTTMLRAYNPGAGKGPDILLEHKKTGEIYYAEILGNDTFHKGQQTTKLIETARELLNDKTATKKYLVVLSDKHVKAARKVLESKIKKSDLEKIIIIPIFIF